jgi:RNA polymerase sigma factor (TIGR02999 family)
MTRLPSAEITGLLRAWSDGDREAVKRLIPLVYRELHHVAHRYMLRERRGRTLQTTALVNEAYVRLVDAANVRWTDRTHFFAVSARIMRRILVDAARERAAAKRGGPAMHVNLEEAPNISTQRGREILVLEDALEALAKVDPRKAEVIELRFYGGLSIEEAAAYLKVSPQTVMRDWKLARAWLLREMNQAPEA